MNKNRRSILKEALKQLAGLKQGTDYEEATALMSSALHDIQQCADEEADSLNNLPENLESSTIAEKMEDNVDDLTDAYSEIEAMLEECEDSGHFEYSVHKEYIRNVIISTEKAINR